MTPSDQEILRGQQAYQRIRVYSRTSRFSGILFLGILAFGAGEQWSQRHEIVSLVVVAVLALVVWLDQNWRKRTYLQDVETIKAFRSKFGDDSLRLLREPPETLFYRIFQKQHFPVTGGNWRSVPDPLLGPIRNRN